MKSPSLKYVRVFRGKFDILFLNRMHYIFSKRLKLSNIGLKKSARSVFKDMTQQILGKNIRFWNSFKI